MSPKRVVEDIKQLALSEIDHEASVIDASIAARVLALVNSYELAFAACDFVEDVQGNLYFLEMNPNGQWFWLQQMTGYDLLNPFVDFICQ